MLARDLLPICMVHEDYIQWITGRLTLGESAVRLVVGRVPARCGCGEEVTFGDRFVVDGLVRRGVPYGRLSVELF